MECKHLSIIGDNYGDSCRDCGKQLSGYGCGGFFGANLTGNETCIHLFAPMFDGGPEVCIYCQGWKPDPDPMQAEYRKALRYAAFPLVLNYGGAS